MTVVNARYGGKMQPCLFLLDPFLALIMIAITVKELEMCAC